ncbi:EF-hand domain-containing protein [Limnoglobus roseus]|uniref:EF-hand domain-containing protein n=1 Tax=Limnoglobus roseus TaxID=2598579 RepID=A0A5C1AHI1_9BACT|nr:EF-hand domain-containing protein [Limnoglobus roseus]QEL17456.1 EF-hand domain-containing protein [Limnoglobus roseus]
MPDEGNISEILMKVRRVVDARFGGDIRAAFDHYDTNRNGLMSMSELNALLADAGVGFWLTRWSWVNGVAHDLDANQDGRVSWAEFEDRFRRV